MPAVALTLVLLLGFVTSLQVSLKVVAFVRFMVLVFPIRVDTTDDPDSWLTGAIRHSTPGAKLSRFHVRVDWVRGRTRVAVKVPAPRVGSVTVVLPTVSTFESQTGDVPPSLVT